MTARLAHIYRHPIKSHGREDVAAVALTAGQALPWDRHWAVTHRASEWQPTDPRWMACTNFILGSTIPALMAINAQLDEAGGQITLTHPALEPLSFCPDHPGGQAAFLAWVAPLLGAERQATALVKAPGRAMTDTDYPSVSIINLASNADLGLKLDADPLGMSHRTFCIPHDNTRNIDLVSVSHNMDLNFFKQFEING